MNVKQFFAFGVMVAAPAGVWGQSVPSQDSILGNSTFSYGGDTAGLAMSEHAQVVAAETTVSLSAAFLHQQYHENATPGTGDDENGYTPGFGVALSGLIPVAQLRGADFYTNLSYNFNAGDITYGGHYLYSGLPAYATDNTVMQRLELRLGVGFPLAHGIEVIPYLAGGYQAWYRNVNQKDEIGTDEFYSSALMGGGIKLDVPAGRWVFSVDGEMLDLVGGRVTFNSVNEVANFGMTGEERAELGADYAVAGRWHSFLTAYWEHFNYSGSKGSLTSLYFYEPLSTTTQFGANLGVAYSFY